jgi:hypothetical protein
MPDVTFPFEVVVKGQGRKSFPNDSYYGGRGGEGTILKDPPTAYKIYHDAKRMIPLTKIEELQALRRLPNVLGPQDVLFDVKKTKQPIGFTMEYVDEREFITSFFNRNYKEEHNITPEMVMALVRNLQTTLQEIHGEKILVVDFNEMNFLVNGKTFVDPYFIDVDSYQTPSHRATAIMESIRDRKIKGNQWTELSDWFSFAVVAFQLYTGVHPYRGKHPAYKVNQWPERMEKGVSVFEADVKLPPSFMGWDVIPKPHLDWFRRIFGQNERSIPPLPDGATILGVLQPVLISSSGKFKVKVVQSYNETIRSVHFSNGNTYVITRKAIYKGSKTWAALPKSHRQIGLVDVPGNDPLIVTKEGDTIAFLNASGAEEASMTAKEAMEYNGLLYTLQAGHLREHSVQRFKRVIIGTKTVAQILSNSKLYKGVVVQEISGSNWLAIPYEPGRCFNAEIKELEGYRIINARYENCFCVVMAEKEAKYHRIVLFFNERHTSYTCRIAEDVDFTDISFAVKGNGVCVLSTSANSVEVTKDNEKLYEYSDPPFDPDIRLLTDGLSIMFFNNRKIYEVTMQ